MVKFHTSTEAEGVALVILREESGVEPATSHRGNAFFFCANGGNDGQS